MLYEDRAFSLCCLRLRYARKATNRIKLRKTHAPIVPPTIAPTLGFEDEGREEFSVMVVGELSGIVVTVTVLASGADVGMAPGVRYAVEMKAEAAQPCCVMVVVVP